MRFLSAIIGLLIVAVAVVFALSNRDFVSVSLWPFDEKIEAPLYVLTLGTLITGVFIGAFLAWIRMLPHQFMSRRLKKEVAVMQNHIEDLKKSLVPPRIAHDLSLLQRPSLRSRWKFWRS